MIDLWSSQKQRKHYQGQIALGQNAKQIARSSVEIPRFLSSYVMQFGGRIKDQPSNPDKTETRVGETCESSSAGATFLS
jgi:hypothetical protein